MGGEDEVEGTEKGMVGFGEVEVEGSSVQV
jgi:hypothetical protein